MKTLMLAVVTLACLATHPVRAQSVDYTDAVSRRVLLVNTRSADYTDAISRRVLLVNTRSTEYTDAITRRVLLVNANMGVEYADANSRRVLLYLPPYTTDEAQKALRLAAGLLNATQVNMDRLNIIRDGDSTGKVDLRDAAKVLRMAVGLDP